MRLSGQTWGYPGNRLTAVLLHGVTSDSGSWVRVGPALAARGFRVVAPDLRGHGSSPKPSGHFTFEELLEDLRDAVPAAPTLVIGHSFGGTLAVLAADREILMPRGLVLEDPVLRFLDRDEPTRILQADEERAPRTLEGVMAANPTWDRIDAEAKVASLSRIEWQHMHEVFVGNAPWDIREAAIRLGHRIPVLVILPERSLYVPPEDAERLSAELGGDAVVAVRGAGHAVHRDDFTSYIDIVDGWTANVLLQQTAK